MDAQTEQHKELRIEIKVNKETFSWHSEAITGQQVLDLVHESANDYLVYIKRRGRDDDPVAPNESVNLADHENRQFRTVPKETTEG